MREELENSSTFRLELSAFLGAARSVLQYACSEAKTKPGGQHWYDQRMRSDLLSFFRDLRNNSVHEIPISPVRKTTTETASMLAFGEDEDRVMIPYSHVRSVQRYEFEERPGSEVIDLSQSYVDELDAVVETGVAGRWITG